MARITESVFKNWEDGETVKASDYKQEREIMRIAINDFDNDVKEIQKMNIGPQGPIGPQGIPGVGSVKQALKKDLPVLSKGELGLTEDTNDVYIGTSTGNELVGGASVMSQLAETANQLIGTNVENECIVSFLGDDFTNLVAEDWLFDLCQSEGIVFNVAPFTSLFSDPSVVNRLKARKQAGWNVVSHTRNHVYLGEITDDNILANETIGASDDMRINGFDHDIIVYPYASKNDKVINVCRKVYKCGFQTVEKINDINNPIRNMLINRVSGIGEAGASLSSCKAKVLEAKNTGGWVVFAHHVKNDWTDATKKDLSDLIKWIKAQGIRIVNLQEGFALKGNIVDVGGTEHYARITRDGNLDTSYYLDRDFKVGNVLSKHGSKYTFNSPLSDYARGEVISMYYRNLDIPPLSASQPFSSGGVKITHRPLDIAGNGDYGGFELFYIYSVNRVYKRRWDVNLNTWGSWEIISSSEGLWMGSVESLPLHSTPLTDFKPNTVNVHPFTSPQVAANGFPGTTMTLLTYRSGNNGIQDRFDELGRKYSRTWNTASSTWGSWYEYGRIKLYSTTIDCGTVTAKGIKQVFATVSGAKRKSIFNVNPDNSINGNLLINITSAADDEVRIKLYNTSDSDIVVGSKTFYISEMLTLF